MAGFTSQTNWKLTSGSFHNVLTFETSLDCTDNDDKLLPLQLQYSPSPDSTTPCQITVNFAKKHVVKEIYVRSTARVYEVYTVADLKSNGKSEFLCTVRCGVAVRDGEVLRCVNAIGNANVKSEDDWVDVKAVDDTNSQTKPYINLTSAAQDLFEATNNIVGAKPCISVTLRLLSLQSKGSVYVDEIYVFGDPIDSEIQESCNEIQFVWEDDLKETPHPNGSAIESLKGKDSITDPHEVELKQVKGGSVDSSQLDTFSQVSINQGDCSGGNVERSLEKLMNRIEEIYLGFQEKMVMPMNNIEARLQRVEQQLDLLSKKPQNFEGEFYEEVNSLAELN